MGDAILYVGALAVALTAIGALMRFVVMRPLRNLIKNEVVAQVAPNGRSQDTTRHLLENLVHTTEKLQSGQEDNRRIAVEALAISRHASSQILEHMKGHP